MQDFWSQKWTLYHGGVCKRAVAKGVARLSLHLGIVSEGAGNVDAPAQRGPRRLEVVEVGSDCAIAVTVSPVIRIQVLVSRRDLVVVRNDFCMESKARHHVRW